MEGLNEEVRYLVCKFDDVHHVDYLGLKFVMNKVAVHLNVLRSFMENRVGNNMDGTSIVAE